MLNWILSRWPHYDKANALKLPPTRTNVRTKPRPYDYSGLTTSAIGGQLQKVEQTNEATEWTLTTPKTDNGRRQSTLSPLDNAQIIERGLNPDKAAFLKPIFALGCDVATGSVSAKSKLQAVGKQTRGYGRNTVKKYWAAFNKALEIGERAPSPTEEAHVLAKTG